MQLLGLAGQQFEKIQTTKNHRTDLKYPQTNSPLQLSQELQQDTLPRPSPAPSCYL